MYGMYVMYGMVWYGMAWYGMVWYGTMFARMHACMHGWMDGWMDGCMCIYIYMYVYIFWVGYFQKSCSHLHQPGALYGHAFVSGRQRHVRNLVGPASHFAGDPSQTEIDAGFPHEKR